MRRPATVGGSARRYAAHVFLAQCGKDLRLDERLGTAFSDQFALVRTMFVAYWIFILAVFAVYFYVGLANR